METWDPLYGDGRLTRRHGRRVHQQSVGAIQCGCTAKSAPGQAEQKLVACGKGPGGVAATDGARKLSVEGSGPDRRKLSGANWRMVGLRLDRIESGSSPVPSGD